MAATKSTRDLKLCDPLLLIQKMTEGGDVQCTLYTPAPEVTCTCTPAPGARAKSAVFVNTRTFRWLLIAGYATASVGTQGVVPSGVG